MVIKPGVWYNIIAHLQQQKLYRAIKPRFQEKCVGMIYNSRNYIGLLNRLHLIQPLPNLQQQKLYRVIKPLRCMMLHKFQNNLNNICEIVITFSLFNNPIWTKINIKTWVRRSQPTISKGESSFLAKPNFFYVSLV